MSDKKTYYARATSWALDAEAAAGRSRRVAWTFAGVAAAVALFEAVAIAMLVPLKDTQTIALLVDRQTGAVQSVDPSRPQRILADEALTNALLAQYVIARESFDRATIAGSYRKVALWSTGRARSSYLAAIPSTNPDSPFQRVPSGTAVQAWVASVSRISQNLALVRFRTALIDRSGQRAGEQPWVAVVRYRFVAAPMRVEDRFLNPLGFQVSGYRRDQEAPPPPPPVVIGSAPSIAAVPAIAATVIETSRSVRETRDVPRAARPRRERSRAATGSPVGGPALDPREVPLNQLPLGSPLSPGARAIGDAR